MTIITEDDVGKSGFLLLLLQFKTGPATQRIRMENLQKAKS